MIKQSFNKILSDPFSLSLFVLSLFIYSLIWVIGLNSNWITSDSYKPLTRDHLLKKHIRAKSPSLLHIHGLWRSPTRIAPSFACIKSPFVVAPHGMLHPSALKRSSWKKSFVWHL